MCNLQILNSFPRFRSQNKIKSLIWRPENNADFAIHKYPPMIVLFRKFTLNQFNVFALILGVAVYIVVFVLRFYDNPQESDVGCFMAIGKALNADAVLYKTVFDNKAPGIFFLHQFFQFLTGNSVHYPLVLQAFFAGIFVVSSALVLFQINKKISFAPILALFLTALFYVQSRWGIFYYGGFTEEIGSYLLLTAVNLLFLSQNSGPTFQKCMAFAAGLLATYALGIKEPFALMFLALAVYVLVYHSKPAKWYYLAGCVLVFLCWGGYLFMHGAVADYSNYIKQAFFYAQSPSDALSARITQRTEPVLYEYSAWLDHGRWRWFIVTFILFLGSIVFSGKSTHPPVKKEAQFLHFLFLILLSSIPFYWFGPKNHTHYFIPLLFCTIYFGAAIVARFLSMIRSEFRLIQVLFSLFILSETNFLYREIKHYSPPTFAKASEEKAKLTTELNLKGNTCFVDDYSAGRLYAYLNVTSNLKYQCAYPVFFEFNAPNSLAEERCKEFVSDFKKHPPKYILGKEKLSMAFDYDELKNWVNLRYRVVDTVELNGMGYCLRELY